MPQPPPNQGPSIPLAQASHLLTTFTHFLTVCIHNILYYRNIYPAQTFLTSRAYNLPVHQSRHPKVCSWIRDAVDALKAQLVSGSVERIAVVIYDDRARVMERWMFDVAAFPAWTGFKEGKVQQRREDDEEDDDHNRAAEDAAATGTGTGTGTGPGGAAENSKVNWSNVHEELRASIRKLAYAGEKMAPLPEGCTFTIAVELREEGEAPIGHPQPWVPAQPNLQTPSKDRPTAGEDVGGAKTVPLRAVEAGPLFFECWVEEGKAESEHTLAVSSASS